MDKTKPVLPAALSNRHQALPDQIVCFRCEAGDFLFAVELPKNPTDPYIKINYEFVKAVPAQRENGNADFLTIASERRN